MCVCVKCLLGNVESRPVPPAHPVHKQHECNANTVTHPIPHYASSPKATRQSAAMSSQEHEEHRGPQESLCRRAQESTGEPRVTKESPGEPKRAQENPGERRGTQKSPGKARRAEESAGEPGRGQESTGRQGEPIQESTGEPKNGQESTGEPSRAQESTGKPRRAQESTGEQRRAQRNPGEPRRAQESPAEHKRAQESPGEPRSAQERPGELRRATSTRTTGDCRPPREPRTPMFAKPQPTYFNGTLARASCHIKMDTARRREPRLETGCYKKLTARRRKHHFI